MKIVLYAETELSQEVGVTYIDTKYYNLARVRNHDYVSCIISNEFKSITDFELVPWTYTLIIL